MPFCSKQSLTLITLASLASMITAAPFQVAEAQAIDVQGRPLENGAPKPLLDKSSLRCRLSIPNGQQYDPVRGE